MQKETRPGEKDPFPRVILLTPNERLSEQHIAEFRESDISVNSFLQSRGSLFAMAQGLDRVDVLEITKLADQEGPNTIATRSLGDQNLLLVDEGHRGLSGKNVKKNHNAWFSNRAMLCEKGFAFEYSATFEQAVSNTGHEDDYAKAVVFDYSYRWFYEDGFGKDYQILNLPESFDAIKSVYLTACLLKFYQQLRFTRRKSRNSSRLILKSLFGCLWAAQCPKPRGQKLKRLSLPMWLRLSSSLPISLTSSRLPAAV